MIQSFSSKSISNLSALATAFIMVISINLTGQEQVADTSNVAISRFDKVKADVKVNKSYIDDRNVIWLATSQGLIETTGDGSKLNYYFEGSDLIDVTSDRKDVIWAASVNTVYNLKTKVTYSLPEPQPIISTLRYHSGNVWVGTGNGLYQLNPGTGKFKLHDNKNSKLISNVINFLHSDKNGILWVGTDEGYLRIKGDKWELQDKKQKMLATCENTEGQWIISDKDMFLINKFNRLFPVKLDSAQFKGKINNFVIDSKGRIYIASDILARYDPYKEEIKNYSVDAATLSRAAISLSADKNDNIWIGTDGSGFYKLLFGEVAQESLLATLIIENSLSCVGNDNAVLKVSLSGGTRPYTYSWSVTSATGAQASGLRAGTYSVTVTDKIQNTSVASIQITDPTPIKIDLVANNRVINPDKPDGSVEINVTGGAGNYTYNWSNGSGNKNLTNVRSGQYNVNVKDKNGCMASAAYLVKREKFIPDLEISKVTEGQKLRINELNFAADSSAITQENFDILEEVYEFLSQNPTVKIEIGGHTNTIPPHEYCDKLSTSRAKGVAQFLFTRGIAKSRVSYKGYGKREPLTDSTSNAGRQKNQRVEVKILKI